MLEQIYIHPWTKYMKKYISANESNEYTVSNINKIDNIENEIKIINYKFTYKTQFTVPVHNYACSFLNEIGIVVNNLNDLDKVSVDIEIGGTTIIKMNNLLVIEMIYLYDSEQKTGIVNFRDGQYYIALSKFLFTNEYPFSSFGFKNQSTYNQLNYEQGHEIRFNFTFNSLYEGGIVPFDKIYIDQSFHKIFCETCDNCIMNKNIHNKEFDKDFLDTYLHCKLANLENPFPIDAIERMIVQEVFYGEEYVDTLLYKTKINYVQLISYIYFYFNDYQDHLDNINIFINGHNIWSCTNTDELKISFTDNELINTINNHNALINNFQNKIINNNISHDIVKYIINPYLHTDKLQIFRNKTIYRIKIDESNPFLFDKIKKYIDCLNYDTIMFHVKLKDTVKLPLKISIAGISKNIIRCMNGYTKGVFFT